MISVSRRAIFTNHAMLKLLTSLLILLVFLQCDSSDTSHAKEKSNNFSAENAYLRSELRHELINLRNRIDRKLDVVQSRVEVVSDEGLADLNKADRKLKK